MSESFTIVRSHPALLKYVEHLQAQNSDALGFLPRRVFEQSTESGRLFLGLLDGDPCGYMLVGSGYRSLLRSPQVCIQYDARRRLYGALLVAAVERYGESIGCSRRVVRCGSDLEANAFCTSLGYHLVGTAEAGAARRHRRPYLNVFTKPLVPAVLVEWATREEIGRLGGQSTSDRKTQASRRRMVASADGHEKPKMRRPQWKTQARR